MTSFLIRRVLFLVITLFFVTLMVFVFTALAPGNIAISTLGNTITPQQEYSFNAQNGLDQPAWVRYRRWMVGSDWEASDFIGKPVVRIFNEESELFSWWVVDPDGTLFQNFTDGESIKRVILNDDLTTREAISSGDLWVDDGTGRLIFWSVNPDDRAAMWVKGTENTEEIFTSAGWISIPGAPVEYIPLSRGLLRGDPGISFKDRRPVSETLWRATQNTMVLASVAFIIVMPLALLLGLIAGLNEGRLIDRLASVTSLVATATPEFASGVMLIVIFSSDFVRETIGIKIPTAVVMSNANALRENPQMLILPVLTLTLIELGYVLRITRASMVEVMRTNYIRTAVLKGLPQRRIVFKHALRNALLAPITIIMLHVNWLLGGLVVVEVLFGFPGLGRYVLQSALFNDYFAVGASAVLLVIIAVATQLLADILYTYLNPRIRYS